MKIAIIDDTLDEFGGSERVALEMFDLYPNTEFYTSFARPGIISEFFHHIPANRFHRLPWITPGLARHRSLLQWMAPIVWRQYDFSGYDLVMSNPGTLMCNIIPLPPGMPHIQYIHTIPKNLYWLEPATPLERLTNYGAYIRPLYKRAILSTPMIITNSHHMQQKIRVRFGITPTILHPPVLIPKRIPPRRPGSYYLCVSRLDNGKHLEIAITACTKIGAPLKIVGVTNDPEYEAYLKSIAGPSIEFLGFRTDRDVSLLYREAKAFLFPSREEDFGIAPLEALAHGVPVIAYSGGGPAETLKHGVTGALFSTHSADGMISAFHDLDAMHIRPHTLRAIAARYGRDRFRKRLASIISAYLGR